MTNRILYIVTCGAPLATRTADGLTASRNRGWQPLVIPTDASSDSEERAPAQDAVAVVPTTFNTLNAWANGTANTYPLVRLSAALGARIPIVAVPFAKHDLAGHSAWLASISVLRYAGRTGDRSRSGAVVLRRANQIRNRRRSDRSLQLGMGTCSNSLPPELRCSRQVAIVNADAECGPFHSEHRSSYVLAGALYLVAWTALPDRPAPITEAWLLTPAPLHGHTPTVAASQWRLVGCSAPPVPRRDGHC